MIRPSSLPMVSKCPHFTGSGDTFADAGTARHKALARLLRDNDPLPLADLPQDEAEAVQWAADYIRLKAPMSDYPLVIEERRTWLRPDFSEARGTPDMTCGPCLFDLKWRKHDYLAQMADYALSMFAAGHKIVNVHVLFGESRYVQEYQFDQESAEAVVMAAISNTGDPTPCDYCGWCATAYKCPAILKHVEEVAKGYTSDPRVHSWHPSKMETGEEIAMGLYVWRKICKPWGSSMEKRANDAAIKEGKTLACRVVEWVLKTVAGKKRVSNVAEAFKLSGMPQDEFLACCTATIETSKKYPDRVGLANKYAAFHGMQLAPAKRALLKRLEPAITQSPETLQLRAAKQGVEEENEE